MDAPLTDTSRGARLDEVLAKYLECLEQGNAASLSAWLDEHPEFRDELPEIVRQFGALNALKTVPGMESLQRLTRFDDFEIVREIGRGGMGVVYEAHQFSLGRRVALKTLPAWALMDHRHVQRFQNESRAAARLQHPHIVPVFAVGCHEGTHYFAMQFVDGCSLKQALDQLREREKRPAEPVEGDDESESSGVASPETSATSHLSSVRGARYFRAVAEIGVAAAEAVEHAHQCGVIHRDVKPANLLLEHSGHPWVTDFGLAAIQGNDSLTETGDLLGTLAYMSPEQAASDGRRVDERTDVYSLGMTLYEMVALRPAFIGKDRRALLRQVLHEEPSIPSRYRARIPYDLETIIVKAIAKEPAERYVSAQALADDLRRFLAGTPVAAQRLGFPSRAIRWTRRRASMVGALLIAAIVTMAAMASSTFYYLRSVENAKGANRVTVPWDSRPLRLDEGSSYAIDALRFAGEDIAQADRMHIDWGDGVENDSSIDVVSKHEFADGPAQHTFRIEFFRGATRLGSRERRIEVVDVPPLVDVRWPVKLSADGGASIKLGRSHDPGKDVIKRCTVDWGDSAIGSYQLPSQPAHQFAQAMTANVRVFAEDDDGVHLVASTTMQVQIADAVSGPTVLSPAWTLARRHAFEGGVGAFLHPLDGYIYVIRRHRENQDGKVRDDNALGLFQIAPNGDSQKIFNEFFLNYAAPHPVTGDIFVQYANPCRYLRLELGSWHETVWATDIRSGDLDPCGFIVTPPEFQGDATAPLHAVIADRGVDGPKEILGFSAEAPQTNRARLHVDQHVLFNPMDVAASQSDVYVIDSAGGGAGQGRVFRLGVGGELRLVEIHGDIGYPAGVAVTRDNRTLYLADMDGNRVLEVDLETGRSIHLIRDLRISKEKAKYPALVGGCIRLSLDDRTLVVTDRGHEAIFVFERR